MNFQPKLGFALVPTTPDQKIIYDLAEQLNLEFDLGFRVTPENAIPHLTGFQGVFSDIDKVIKKLASLDFSFIEKEQTVEGISFWAKKIIFLDYEFNTSLEQFHQLLIQTFEKGIDYEGTSADPQVFEGLTTGQEESFEQTGYPFYGDEFLPHTTLAHLKAAPNTDLRKILASVRKKSTLSESITFTKFVVFEVETLGKSTKVLWERDI